MKIEMYGMSPEGKIVYSGAEIYEGKNAKEIVQAMMNATPASNGQTETAFMNDVLARLGKSLNPVNPNGFLQTLQRHGLISQI